MSHELHRHFERHSESVESKVHIQYWDTLKLGKNLIYDAGINTQLITSVPIKEQTLSFRFAYVHHWWVAVDSLHSTYDGSLQCPGRQNLEIRAFSKRLFLQAYQTPTLLLVKYEKNAWDSDITGGRAIIPHVSCSQSIVKTLLMHKIYTFSFWNPLRIG